MDAVTREALNLGMLASAQDAARGGRYEEAFEDLLAVLALNPHYKAASSALCEVAASFIRSFGWESPVRDEFGTDYGLALSKHLEAQSREDHVLTDREVRALLFLARQKAGKTVSDSAVRVMVSPLLERVINQRDFLLWHDADGTPVIQVANRTMATLSRVPKGIAIHWRPIRRGSEEIGKLVVWSEVPEGLARAALVSTETSKFVGILVRLLPPGLQTSVSAQFPDSAYVSLSVLSLDERMQLYRCFFDKVCQASQVRPSDELRVAYNQTLATINEDGYEPVNIIVWRGGLRREITENPERENDLFFIATVAEPQGVRVLAEYPAGGQFRRFSPDTTLEQLFDQ